MDTTSGIGDWLNRLIIAGTNFSTSFKCLIKVLLCKQTDNIDTNEIVTENNQRNITNSNIRINSVLNSNAIINNNG